MAKPVWLDGHVLIAALLSCLTALPAFADETIRARFTSPAAPPPYLASETAKWWADEVAARSDGRIEWQFFWMGALTKAGEELEAVEIGLADVGVVSAPYYAGKLPLANWTYAVPFGPGDPEMILGIVKRLYRDVPALSAEVAAYNQKVLTPLMTDTYNLTSKFPIETVADFDGVKIASIGSYHPRILRAAGAAAIAMPVAERYSALQTGIINADFLPWDVSFAYKFQDFDKDATWVDMGAAMSSVLTVNLDFWRSLPDDMQAMMLEVADEAIQRQADLLRTRRADAIAGFEAAGVAIHQMKPGERVKWANALPDIPGEWIGEMERKGLAGQQVMVEYLELLEEAGHEFPRRWAAEYR